VARRRRRRGGRGKRRTSRHDKIIDQNLHEGEGAGKRNHLKISRKKERCRIYRAGKDREDTLAGNRSSMSMGGYTGLSRSWTFDRRSQGRRPSFGHQIRGSDGGDPTLMLMITVFLLIGRLGSKHLRGMTAGIDGGRRVRPSGRGAGSSAASNRR